MTRAINHQRTLRKRKSTRMEGYDYSLPGAYFMTIVIQDRLCLFGDVVDDEVRPNLAGIMAQQSWEELPLRFPSIDLDAFVVMPNHIHGIVLIHRPVGASLVGALAPDVKRFGGVRKITSVGPSLGDVVGAYKSITTVRYGQGVKANGWRRFTGRLWQRNYYERVIRDAEEMERAREYIVNNPIGWKEDPENTDASLKV